jgi:hypothetical protein
MSARRVRDGPSELDVEDAFELLGVLALEE